MGADTKRPGAARADGEVVLRCERLVVGYRGQALLPPIDVEVRRGQLLLVVGRNGAGKSTWLKTVLGLLPPVGGRIRTASPAVEMTYVPQDALLDDLLPVSAATVLSWGRIRGWSFLRPLASRADRQACRDALARAEAADFAGEPFRDLSGGQRQRVLFARLLASGSDIALLDEPTASMDMASERRAYQQLADLARDEGQAIVIITHTIATALGFADAILFVDREGGAGDGEGQDPDQEGQGEGGEGDGGTDDGGTDGGGEGDRAGVGTVVAGTPDEVVRHPLFRRYFGDLSRSTRRNHAAS